MFLPYKAPSRLLWPWRYKLLFRGLRPYSLVAYLILIALLFNTACTVQLGMYSKFLHDNTQNINYVYKKGIVLNLTHMAYHYIINIKFIVSEDTNTFVFNPNCVSVNNNFKSRRFLEIFNI